MTPRNAPRPFAGIPSLLLFAVVAASLVSGPLAAGSASAADVTTPMEFLGHDLGEDYYLANYQDLMGYWSKLEQESDRMKVVNIGTTAEGRTQLMAVVTSPENHARLDHYRQISKRMADAEGIDAEQAKALAAEGKSIVWIDSGLHASEVLCAQAMMETVYRILESEDEETQRILDDVIILFVHANPDGHDLVADWYMREENPEDRSSRGLPRLYQKYIGHDNNRDFFANTQAETKNMNRVMYLEWLPQIVYNHHQTGPSGTVLFCPPFRDPFNYNIDPMVISGIDGVGAAMMQRFLVEGKPGATTREGASYSTWWNGGLRTTAYFHNMIGLLTETIGNPTPTSIRFRPSQQLPDSNYLAPIEPQEWHFRQSVEYSVTANMAVLDYASRNREHLLYNIWHMGNKAIEQGNQDSWTVTPGMVKDAEASMARDGGRGARGGNRAGGNRGGQGRAGQGRGGQTQANQAAGQNNQGDNQTAQVQANQGNTGQRGAAQGTGNQAGGNQARGGRGQGRGGRRGGRGRGGLTEEDFARMFRDPAKRNPRGFIIPANQTDYLTATKFVNVLMGTGIVVHRATDEFEVNGTSYPAGSYVVKSAQAFRAHALDMFEPQDHPDDFAFPGAAPTAPYDIAGWTLAYSMGVKFDRVLDGFDGPFERLDDLVAPPSGRVLATDGASGYYLDTRTNDAFRAVNRLVAAGEEVHRLQTAGALGDRALPAGTFYVANNDTTSAVLGQLAEELGVSFLGTPEAPSAESKRVDSLRIGLWDRNGGSMPSGWTRWILEQFEFPFDVVFANDLEGDDLRSRYDVLIFVTGALSGRGGGVGAQSLRSFMEQGGTVVTIGGSTSLAEQLELPVGNHLVEFDEEGEERRLGRDEFYVPGSLLRVRVDNTQPLAWGLDEDLDVMFSNGSPTFRFLEDANAEEAGLSSVAWFETDTPLRSGWAWGQHHLNGGVSIIDARVGEGRLALFGPEVLFRGQPHGTFKFVFNAIINGQSPATTGDAETR